MQLPSSDYSRGSLRQIKLKRQVEGLIEVLSIKEIMERKTAKDTKVDGSDMAGPHIAAGKAVPRDYATIDLATPQDANCPGERGAEHIGRASCGHPGGPPGMGPKNTANMLLMTISSHLSGE